MGTTTVRPYKGYVHAQTDQQRSATWICFTTGTTTFDDVQFPLIFQSRVTKNGCGIIVFGDDKSRLIFDREVASKKIWCETSEHPPSDIHH
jgi:hypothetical protein